MNIADEPAVIYITANVGDGGECRSDIGGVMHGQEKACQNLGDQT